MPDWKSALDPSKRDKEVIASQRKQLQLLSQRIEDLQGARFRIPTLTRTRFPAQKTFKRVIFNDTHGSSLDPLAWGAFLRDLEDLQPQEILANGDIMECGGFLAQHHTLGYVAQSEYTFQQDIDAANQQFDMVQKAAPNARIRYIEGNHEHRIEAWCVTQALRNQQDAKFLLDAIGTPTVLRLKERGIEFFKQGECYMGLTTPGTLKLGKCYFTHGFVNSKASAIAMLHKFSSNVVFAHSHRRQEWSDEKVANGDVSAWCVPCLCKKQPMWKHTDPSGWNHGYGLQIVQADGSFLHINVPIINGRSYLTQLTAPGQLNNDKKKGRH